MRALLGLAHGSWSVKEWETYLEWYLKGEGERLEMCLGMLHNGW